MVYGRFTILGYRSWTFGQVKDDQKLSSNETFVMDTRVVANGRIPAYENSKLKSQYSVIIAEKHKALDTVPYCLSNDFDDFQIGRMPVKENDFIVPGGRYELSGTVSRFAARICCDRSTKQCRVFASGFNRLRQMVLRSTSRVLCRGCQKWFSSVTEHDCVDDKSKECAIRWDALTTNGIRIWYPSSATWFEVSVHGFLYNLHMDEERRTTAFQGFKGRKLARPRDPPVKDVAVLTDGCILDIGDVRMLFQSTTMKNEVTMSISMPNTYCPIFMNLLEFTTNNQQEDGAETMHASYFPCGHVVGYSAEMRACKLCPLCRAPGKLRKLFDLRNATEKTSLPEQVFMPCNHVASTASAEQYAQIFMSNGRAICPYCGNALANKQSHQKLYFYSEAEE